MSKKRLLDLIPQIESATEKGEVTWSQESEHVFSAKVGKYSVFSWSGEELDGANFFSASLRSGDATLDSVTALEYEENFKPLSNFYACARRSALNVEAVIDEIESILKKRP